jgi:peptidoglycan-associated lipoprotein
MNTSSSLPLLFLAAASVACSHAQPVAAADATQKPTLAVSGPPPAGPAPAPPAGQAELDRALDELRGVSVFFPYDEATLSFEAEQKLAEVGSILAKHPRLTVLVAGNADERGSEQYNLALGQRRAAAAKKYLLAMGAGPQQVGTISYGAEKPKATGHDETAWQQNRRDDVEVRR